MSLFPRFTSGEFTPLFRLLDDYATHTVSRGSCSSYRPTPARTFQPRFDVREDAHSYQLEGELPGINQQDVSIDFTDAQTLSVKGSAERHFDSRTDVPGHDSTTTAEQDDFVAIEHTPEPSDSGSVYHKASVEDETAATPQGDTAEQASGEVVRTAEQSVRPAPKRPSHKYWVSERSIGAFHRTFHFPGRIDQDKVKASLRNGILAITVPKAQIPPTRRISIE